MSHTISASIAVEDDGISSASTDMLTGTVPVSNDGSRSCQESCWWDTVGTLGKRLAIAAAA